MNERGNRERLYWLIELLKNNEIEIDDFCNEFHITYDHDTRFDELTEEERDLFKEIAYDAARFSEDPEEHKKYPGIYSTVEEVIGKIKKAMVQLGI